MIIATVDEGTEKAVAPKQIAGVSTPAEHRLAYDLHILIKSAHNKMELINRQAVSATSKTTDFE